MASSQLLLSFAAAALAVLLSGVQTWAIRPLLVRIAPANAMTVTAAISVAAITAMPAPCGVGMRWDERAFGLASAIRTSSGRIAHVRTPDDSAASTVAANDSSSCELAILSA